MQQPQDRFLLLALASASLLPACRQSTSIADVLLVASVEVTPATAVLNRSETLQLVAIPRTEGGLELPARNVTWSSSAPSRVSVSDQGEVHALTPGGPVTITAEVEGVQGEARITVVAVASQITISRQPSATAQSGVRFATQPLLLVKDNAGNPVPGVVVSVTLASGGGTLNGTLTTGSDANGIAGFGDLSITGLVGTRKLSFSATGGAPEVTSNSINVTAGPASQLSITTQPATSVAANTSFNPQPVIQLRDFAGNSVSQSGVAVTAAINSAQGEAVLGGTLTVNTNGSGIATFTNLKFSKSGSYTLKFTSAGLSQAVSSLISVH